jgi:hypothetical protein
MNYGKFTKAIWKIAVLNSQIAEGYDIARP